MKKLRWKWKENMKNILNTRTQKTKHVDDRKLYDDAQTMVRKMITQRQIHTWMVEEVQNAREY